MGLLRLEVFLFAARAFAGDFAGDDTAIFVAFDFDGVVWAADLVDETDGAGGVLTFGDLIDFVCLYSLGLSGSTFDGKGSSTPAVAGGVGAGAGEIGTVGE